MVVSFKDVEKKYNDVLAVKNMNLEIKQAEMLVLIGPSGCGKTTTLKMVNRIINPSSGKIFINNQDTDALDPITLRREIGYVIQEGGLFPHKTVADNIAVVPKLKKWDKETISRRIDELLNLVNMEPEIYRMRYPRELSGGQQQRIGVLRALAAKPDVMLMDEPFAALDPITREQLQDELKHLQNKVNKTIIFVTHSMDEALKIGDRIALMKDGEIIQVDTPKNIIKYPKNDFVVDFIGKKRLLKGADEYAVHEIMEEDYVSVLGQATLENLQNHKLSDSDYFISIDGDQHYQGVVSIKDVQQNLDQVNTCFEDILVSHPHLYEDDNVKGAVQLMLDHNLSFVPVLSTKEKVKGILTKSSIYSFLLEHM